MYTTNHSALGHAVALYKFMFNYSLLAHPSAASLNFPPLPTPLFFHSLSQKTSAIIYSPAAKPTFGIPKYFPNALQVMFAEFCDTLNTRCFKTLLTLSLLCNLQVPGCTEKYNKYSSVLLSCFDSYRRQFLVGSHTMAQSHQDLDKETC